MDRSFIQYRQCSLTGNCIAREMSVSAQVLITLLVVSHEERDDIARVAVDPLIHDLPVVDQPDAAALRLDHEFNPHEKAVRVDGICPIGHITLGKDIPPAGRQHLDSVALGGRSTG